MKIYLYLAALVLLSFSGHPLLRAQGENNNWCFGHRATLSFNGSSPSFSQNSMVVYEGSASVSDGAGNLLFYTSGSKVWDNNGNLMPNGGALAGNAGSSMHGVAIVQSVSNPSQYYVITTDQVESGLANAYYSVVDMSLNGGTGDVIPAQSSVLIDTGISEGVIVTTRPGCNGYWVILQRKFSKDYRAYHLDAAGIANSPVVSACPYGMPGALAYTTFNAAGNRIAATWGTISYIASFDNTTGIFSNFISFNFSPVSMLYNLFSPDGEKLYFSGLQPASPSTIALYQADLSLLPNVTAVENSVTPLIYKDCRGMRMGPDNKIYVLRILPAYMARINNPNAAGTACAPDTAFLQMPPYATQTPNGPALFLELGNPVAVHVPDTLISAKDTTICLKDKATLKAPAGYNAYRWSTGSRQPTETVEEDGVYWVSGIKNCILHIDSFKVHFNRFTIDLGPDTFLCEGQTRTLNVTTPNATYQWQDGSTGATYTVNQAGTYSVAVSREQCTAYDTVRIAQVIPRVSITIPDTTICEGASIELQVVATPPSQFLWNTGSTADRIVVDKAGVYKVTGTNVCSVLSDEVTIAQITCNCSSPFVPNAFSPNGDDKNETLKVRLNCPGHTNFHFALYNRYGQRIFESTDPDTGWNGLQQGNKADVGTYFYLLRYKTNEGKDIQKKGDVILLR